MKEFKYDRQGYMDAAALNSLELALTVQRTLNL